jgi:ATP-binding cassette, subfamily B, bacterial
MSTGTLHTLQQTLPGARRIFLRFWPDVRQHRPLVVGACLALIASTAMKLLEPWPLKFVFDHVLRVHTRRSGRLPDIAVLGRLDAPTVLLISAAGLLVIVGLRALTEYFSTFLFAVIGNRVMAKVRDRTYRHVQRLPMSFHTARRGGDLIVRVINDVNMLRDAVVTAVLPLAANVLVLVGMWGVMFWLQWRLALLALSVLPLLWLRTVRIGRLIRDAARKQRQRQGAMASTAAEAIGAIKVVQALSLEERFATEFSRRNAESQRQDVKTSKLGARLERGVDLMIALATAMVLYYGTRLAMRGELSPGELLVFLAYLRKAFNPVQDLAKYTARLAKATAAGERVLDLLDRTPKCATRRARSPPRRSMGTFVSKG